MTPSLWQSVRGGLIVPLLLVASLAGLLGFVVARGIYSTEQPARLSVVSVRGSISPTPTPEPTPEATPTAAPRRSGRRGGSGRRCPVGCECEFPQPGGIQIVCNG
jgi:hypothetical protein